ncbi:hypothetical protein JYU29_05620 [Tianweitania sp. BSSL-BM11]|uniref:Putative tail fiber protein gp53-like C-terminal domain-containing protein n=1 Tax=Tianweitania aestuarii TaxID=2814886 RepID=A0ABS5RVC0_9HYPH|nr:hypothetical protein [Tianweitania aestuarii]MBS9720164.1 hypothetical protein [Tianweitania aestuarii]
MADIPLKTALDLPPIDASPAALLFGFLGGVTGMISLEDLLGLITADALGLGDVKDDLAALATAVQGKLSASPGSVKTANLDDGAVTLAKQASVATASFLGRAAAGNGVQEVLSVAQAVALLGFTQSLNANGYLKLPGGLMIQWGKTAAIGDASVTFPAVFPNACYAVVPVLVYSANAATMIVGCSIDGVTAAKFDVRSRYQGVGGESGILATPINWIAVGR